MLEAKDNDGSTLLRVASSNNEIRKHLFSLVHPKIINKIKKILEK
jgi:hypothetical protein